jgi:hypothetical protein
MKKKLAITLFAILVLCAFSFNTSASIITIGIEATVNGVNDSRNLLEGKVTVGSTITGFYIYDSLAQDEYPEMLDWSVYRFATNPYGISLTVGDTTFQTDPANINLTIGISNDFQNEDGYGVGSRNNLMLANGTIVDKISWDLIDNLGTAISNTDLPVIPPDLSKWSLNNLVISGGIGGNYPIYEKSFAINAQVTSAYLIPEPVSLMLFGFGLLVLRKHK